MSVLTNDQSFILISASALLSHYAHVFRTSRSR